jgi:hypothetical protein
MPGAHAMTAAVTAQEAADSTEKTCPGLDSVGAVGDAFCNPYRISDFESDVMEADPADIVLKVKELDDDNFIDDDSSESDVPEINTKMGGGDDASKLMEYIVYCGQRDSPLGMTDFNIADNISSGATTLESQIPVWGGIADIIQAGELLKKIGYVSGESCVAKEADSDTKQEVGSRAFTWDEARYYQRFIEDQRFMESTGMVEKSSVTIALDKYYEENPVDTSYEGVMARMTGMTKEGVIAASDMIDYFLWIADYKPDGYFPYNYEEPESEQIAIEDDDLIIDLDEYNTVDDDSWKYMLRMEYNIS